MDTPETTHERLIRHLLTFGSPIVGAAVAVGSIALSDRLPVIKDFAWGISVGCALFAASGAGAGAWRGRGTVIARGWSAVGNFLGGATIYAILLLLSL